MESHAAPPLFDAALFDLEGTLVEAGPAGLRPMPGARELLERLRRSGLKLGLASNCSRDFLEQGLRALGDGTCIDRARCLDSAQVRDKSDMVAQLLECFGTRSAFLVGDREVDGRAARANAVPFIHLRGASLGSELSCQAHIGGLEDLDEVLARRRRWIERALEELGLGSAASAGRPPGCLGITGRPGAGKSIFARDVVRLLRERRIACELLSADAFARAEPDASAGEDHLARAFDWEALVERALAPHRRGELAVPGRVGTVPIQPDAVLVLEGLFLLDPRLRLHQDRIVHLGVGLETAASRIAARARSGAAAAAERALRECFWPAHERFEARLDPRLRADLVLDAENPLGPPQPSGGPQRSAG
jgi:ribonucleotide monophosphatase NagD (HAD superfamily)